MSVDGAVDGRARRAALLSAAGSGRRFGHTAERASVSAEGTIGQGEVTRLLRAAREGDREALGRIVPLVYDELRGMAQRRLGRERGPGALHPTDLVHEAYLKLAGGEAVPANDRAHFLALAAHVMRQVLIDHARRQHAVKRGGRSVHTTLSDSQWTAEFAPEDLLALDEALEHLEPRQRQVVECRFFGGMEETEIAAALGVTTRTVRRDWAKARARLYRRLYGDAAPPADAEAE